MSNIPGNTAAPTFDSPLDMLHACHERIMDQCATLQKLMSHLPMHGCDTQAQQAAQAVMRYFDTAGKFHHQDEEIDLFPLLRACNNDEANKLAERLLDEHLYLDEIWMNLRARLQEIADGKLAALERTLVGDFSLAYGRHVMLENTKLLPLAARLLNEQQLHEVGKNMAQRRGVTLT
jgi:hemerythrin-like domain-containing protein